jgi:hypothetical protein
MIQILPTIDRQEFVLLERLLNKQKIPTQQAGNRFGFPKFRAMTFGLTRYRCDRFISCAKANENYPELFQELFRIGEKYCPISFTSVYINNNIVCPKHLDKGNNGLSCIISLGDYTGCNLVIEDKIYDAKYTPIVFDGTKLEHWNENTLVGDKYSLVFFNVRN